jgi:hypothetical protein
MSLHISAKAQNHFAKVWLDATCVVRRVVGYGANSDSAIVDTAVPYKHEVLGNPGFISMDDGSKAELQHLCKFAVGSNVEPKDIIIDDVTGERFILEARISGTFKFLESFTAVSQQKEPGE